jgi:hypothetical protein
VNHHVDGFAEVSDVFTPISVPGLRAIRSVSFTQPQSPRKILFSLVSAPTRLLRQLLSKNLGSDLLDCAGAKASSHKSAARSGLSLSSKSFCEPLRSFLGQTKANAAKGAAGPFNY